MKQAPELAYEPLLQTGQARLGALDSRCRDLAGQPHTPVGQADWGREHIAIRGLKSRTDVAPLAGSGKLLFPANELRPSASFVSHLPQRLRDVGHALRSHVIEVVPGMSAGGGVEIPFMQDAR